MARPSRVGFTGNPNYKATARDRAQELATTVKRDAAMAAAVARDYPVATGTLVLGVGALALLAGYLIGSTQEQQTSRRWW